MQLQQQHQQLLLQRPNHLHGTCSITRLHACQRSSSRLGVRVAPTPHTRRRIDLVPQAAAAASAATLSYDWQNNSSLLVGGTLTPHTRLVPRAAAASAATLSYDSQNNTYLQHSRAAAEMQPVPPLPPPPSSTTDWSVLPYLWSLALAEKSSRWRIGVAFVCMLASKASGLGAPLCLKAAVDSLSAGTAAVTLIPAVRWVLCFGLCGITQHLTKELTYPTFTPVSQAVARRVAYQTFSHVLELDITFHMNRRTGRLSRILERGTRSIQMLYRAVLFTFAPTFIELIFVVGLLASRFSPMVAALVGCTFALYVAWTLSMTQAAVEVRKQVNQLDNLTTSKAVDALLNAETVALFGNRQLEVNQYDTYLRGYQAAAIQTERLAALLNAGQSIILSAGLTCVMVAAVLWGPAVEAAEAAMAAAAAAAGSAGGTVAAAAAAGLRAAGSSGVAAARASPGDLVLLQGLLLQLWAPLQFLGWFYREVRQSLVDMEEFFDILKTQNSLPSGNIPMPDIPPSLADSTLQERLLSHSQASSSSSSSGVAGAGGDGAAAAADAAGGSNGSSGSNGGTSSSSRPLDQQDLVEAALLLEEQQHPQHAGQLSQKSGSMQHNLGSSDQHWGMPDRTVAISGLGLEVQLDDVRFGYQPERQVVRGVSMHIKPGESVALVGPSGSAKSTILKLVTRLYDAAGGSVKVNGVDVRDLTTDSLRSAVAVVPQDTVLFNDTILQNIRYGRPTATDDEVVVAAKLAHLHDAVLRMPEGYKTMVGERGLKLSGGEKQRVAIARAFLRAPRLLICDEATSALDTATEASILSSLDELARGRTSIFVAHRLSTVVGCDRILVLAEGRVVEQGSHAVLLEQGGVYADMWRAQAEDRSGSGDDSVADEAESDSVLVEPLPALSGRAMRQRG